MSSRSWCYTLNNYTEKDVAQFKAFECTVHRCALEVGDAGTKHMQGVITFTKTYRLSGLKKLSKCHWEICGDMTASMNYCTKGEIVIDINNKVQGKRNDLENISEMIKNGSNNKEIATKYPTNYIRYHRGFEALRDALELYEDPEKLIRYPTKVIILYGPPGTGKSYMARNMDKWLYLVNIMRGDRIVWEKYRGEKTILFDDFYGNVPYADMLRICDEYPMMVDQHGKTSWRRWTTVIITSNKPYTEWWRGWGDEKTDLSAFERRLETVTEVTSR